MGVIPADRGRASWTDLATFKTHAPCDPEIPLLEGYLCKMPKMLNASWFALAQEERGTTSAFCSRWCLHEGELLSQTLEQRNVPNLLSENKSKTHRHRSGRVPFVFFKSYICSNPDVYTHLHRERSGEKFTTANSREPWGVG